MPHTHVPMKRADESSQHYSDNFYEKKKKYTLCGLYSKYYENFKVKSQKKAENAGEIYCRLPSFIYFHLVKTGALCIILYWKWFSNISAQGPAESQGLENLKSVEISCKLSKYF